MLTILNDPVMGALSGKPLLDGARWTALAEKFLSDVFTKPIENLPLSASMADLSTELLELLRAQMTNDAVNLPEESAEFLAKLLAQRGIVYFGIEVASIGRRLPGWKNAIGRK